MVVRDDDYIRLNYISDFIEEFVATPCKERLHYLLSKPKRRAEIPYYFHSDSCLEPKWMHPLTLAEQNATTIHHKMRALGASSQCFVLSMRDAYKDQVNLKEALEEYVGQSIGTLLYCREAVLCYWEGHDGERCLLHKRNS